MRVEAARGWVMEPAVSGRSRCRGCQQKIAEGAPRVGVRRELVSSQRFWMHPHCASESDPIAVAELVERWPKVLKTPWLQIEQHGPPTPEALGAAIGRPEALLPLLNQLWRVTRSVEVARLIQRVSALDPEDPIRTLGQGTKRTLNMALQRAWEEPQDARWMDLILPWFDTPPFSNAFDTWYLALGVLDRCADPRCLQAIRTRSQDSAMKLRDRFGTVAGPMLTRWMVARVRHGFPRITDPIALPEPDLEEVWSWLETREDGSTTRTELLHRAADGDDSALLVYADTLATEGDLRGEFLQLTMMSGRTPDQQARFAELRKDWRSLVGGLRPAALRDGLSFDRGLPVLVTARPPPPIELDRVLNSPDWASVVHLRLHPNAQRRTEPSLVLAPHARRLRTVALPDLATLLALTRCSGSNPTVYSVTLGSAVWGSWANRPIDLAALPGLTSLIIFRHGPHHARVLEALRRLLPGVHVT